MTARIGVVVFPGTNCEQDVAWAVQTLGGTPEMLWHADRSLAGVDAVILAGGFAHGDYLRTGAIARFSPVMEAVAEFAASGGPVREVRYLDLRDSMENGGGPACLRQRIVLTPEERAAVRARAPCRRMPG